VSDLFRTRVLTLLRYLMKQSFCLQG